MGWKARGFRALWGGERAPSGRGVFLGPGKGGGPALLQPHPLAVSPLSHSAMAAGEEDQGPRAGLSLGSLRAWGLPWLMPEPSASFLSPGLEAPIRPMSVTCSESPRQSTFGMHLASTGRRPAGSGSRVHDGVSYNPAILCYQPRIPPPLRSALAQPRAPSGPSSVTAGRGGREADGEGLRVRL